MMREFNKVHLIALPRCATVSLCDGLGALGIRVAHLGKIYGEHSDRHYDVQRLIGMHQQIRSGDFYLRILNDCDGLADYPACIAEVYEALDHSHPGSLFINVRRDADPQAWLQSAERQFVGLQLLSAGREATPQQRAFMQAMIDFRRMTFGTSDFDAAAFRLAYDRHQQQIQRYFAGRRGVLLDIPDVSLLGKHGFDLLCDFLICPKPSAPFPQRTGHSEAPTQAFLAALRRGDVVSQTGIDARQLGDQ